MTAPKFDGIELEYITRKGWSIPPVLRKVSKLYCCCYMDGAESEMGYKYTVRGQFACGYSAYKKPTSLRYFMDNYGLKVDKSTVEMHDYRVQGHGRVLTFEFEPKLIEDVYFWKAEEIPTGARAFVGLENGSYVTLYAVDEGDKVTIYRPNPNAKDVYIPYDYFVCMRYFG